MIIIRNILMMMIVMKVEAVLMTVVVAVEVKGFIMNPS